MTAGAVLLVAAVVVLVRAFARFVVEGGGTPAPVAPTERLVVGGDYRFVRNPMYFAVVTAVLGQAMIFGSLALLIYAFVVWAIMAAFVRWYEEPLLLERYGDDYQRYRQAVRAWVPRLHPWPADIDHADELRLISFPDCRWEWARPDPLARSRESGRGSRSAPPLPP